MKFIKINLESELLKTKERDTSFKKYLKDNQKFLKESEKFLQNQKSDIEILEKLGISTSITKGNSILDKIKKDDEQNSLLPEYEERRVFTIDQIKSLCLDYRLRFLPSKLYKGSIDEKLPEKVREFEMTSVAYKQAVEYAKRSYYTSKLEYFICAPANSFELKDKNLDPLLFIRISEDRYYLIYKWGNDLSIFRRVLGFFTKNGLSCFISSFISTLISTLFFFYLIDIFHPGTWMISGLISLFGSIAHAMSFTSTAENWDSEFNN